MGREKVRFRIKAGRRPGLPRGVSGALVPDSLWIEGQGSQA